MVRPRLRRPSPVYLTIPTQKEHVPVPLSAFEDSSSFRHKSSTSVSGIFISPSPSSRHTVMASRPPTLTEILLDVSPPPWTLSAFMAYLSQNHCMETLEFTLDSQRYAAFYDQLATESPPSQDSNARVCGWWDKLMEVYIVPCAPREVNIPARVRDCLLSLPSRPTPPHPAELEEAGRIVYELMNDSLLVPFLQSVAPIYPTVQNDDDSQYNHRRRSQNNSHHSDQPRRSVTSPHSADFDSLTDDSDSNAASAAEPMTPPTTPPTSEYTFNSSPGGFQRAMAAHNKGWKKVGEKLGFSRKASSRRSTPTSSSASDYDAALGEPSQSHS